VAKSSPVAGFGVVNVLLFLAGLNSLLMSKPELKVISFSEGDFDGN
jgi:hypothetical protein